jgi:hypothetical protein
MIYALIWLVFGIIAAIWVTMDATDRHGDNLGCLWGLMVFALGPIALIAYIVVRESN